MIAEGNLSVWIELCTVLTVGGAAIVLLAELAQALVGSAVWRRAIWQISVLSLVVLVVAELGGVGDGIVNVCRGPIEVSDQAPLESAIAERATSDSATKAPSAKKHQRLNKKVVELESAMPVAAPLEFQHAKADEARPALETADLGFDSALEPRAPLPSEPTMAASLAVVKSLPKPPEAVSPTYDGTDRAWWPAWVWLAGTVIVAVRFIAGRCLLAWMCAHRGKAVEPAARQRFRMIARRLGLSRKVRLVEMPGLSGAIAFGVFRPSIGLPASLDEQFAAGEQEAMFAHEIAHLAGHDPLWQLAADAASALLWWHPLAWWARSRLSGANESVADESSLVLADGPDALASCLVKLGRRLLRRRELGWIGVSGTGFRSALGRRVQRLLSLAGQRWQRPPTGRLRVMKFAGTAALLAAALLVTASARRQASPLGGEPEMQAFRHSWQRSLGGLALLAALGPAPLSAYPDEPDPAAQVAAEDQGKVRDQLEALKSQIDELRKAGRDEEAKGLEAAYGQLIEGELQRAQLPDDVRQKLLAMVPEFFKARAEGRLEDAERIEKQAKEIVQQHAPKGDPIHDKFARLNREIAELRASGRTDEADKLEQQLRAEIEQHQFDPSLPAELREKLENVRRQYLQLREEGKVAEADQLQRDTLQFMSRFQDERKDPEGDQRGRGEGDRRRGEADRGRRMELLRAAAENLKAAGLHEMAAQVQEQIGRLERGEEVGEPGRGRGRGDGERRPDGAGRGAAGGERGRGRAPSGGPSMPGGAGGAGGAGGSAMPGGAGGAGGPAMPGGGPGGEHDREIMQVLRQMRQEIENLRRDVNELRERGGRERGRGGPEGRQPQPEGGRAPGPRGDPREAAGAPPPRGVEPPAREDVPPPTP